MLRNIFLLFVAVFIISCTNGQKQANHSQLSVTEFAEKLAEQKEVQLIDVRTPEEFKKGHLEGALNMDWNGSEFEHQLAALDKSKPVFLYCLSGRRSADAAQFMRNNGFDKVYEMTEGMMGWRAEGLDEKLAAVPRKEMSLQQYETLLDGNKLVLVDFYADWCAPCKKMEPYLTKIATEMADKVTLVRIDADQHMQLCKDLGIVGLPYLKLYKNHQLVWENMGYIEEAEVREQLIR